MKKLSIALFVAGMMMSMLAVSASAATLTNIDFPVSATISDPCTGVDVTLSGTQHLAIRMTMNGNTAHASITLNTMDVQGTGEDGTQYIYTSAGSETVNIDLTDGSGEGTVVTHENLVSRGSAANSDVFELVHLTVNADGTVTATIDTMSSSCQG